MIFCFSQVFRQKKFIWWKNNLKNPKWLLTRSQVQGNRFSYNWEHLFQSILQIFCFSFSNLEILNTNTCTELFFSTEFCTDGQDLNNLNKRIIKAF